MKLKPIFLAVILLLGLAAASAPAAELRLETQLVWATRDATSPNPRHHPVDGEVARKLAGLPLKWPHFFVENRRDFLATTTAQTIELSKKCVVVVRDAGSDKVEVVLYGNGKPVWKGVQPLPHGEILVLGGNAPGDNAWLVTLKRKD
jgi:hypothetical protein